MADKAIEIAEKLNGQSVDTAFVEEAAMLHDIGIFLTDAPSLGCSGPHPYLRHGYLGARILKKEGRPKHALVCERHVGVGITRQNVLDNGLPLPARDMLPVTIEEKIICYADKFFSKNGSTPTGEKSLDMVVQELRNYGIEQVDRFREWHEKFF